MLISDDTTVHLNVHVDVRRLTRRYPHTYFRTIDRQNKYASGHSSSRDYKTESTSGAHNIVPKRARVWDERSRCSLIRPAVPKRSMKIITVFTYMEHAKKNQILSRRKI